MLVVVTYDVSTKTAAGRRRLLKVSRTCTGFGMRVQFSVFECDIDPAQWEALRTRLLKLISFDDDSLRFYFMGSDWQRRVEQHGRRKAPDMEGLLII